MNNIRIPLFKENELIENDIEKSILDLFPTINYKQKSLSKKWTERVLIFINYIDKNIDKEPINSDVKKQWEGDVRYLQIPKLIKEAMISNASNSNYFKKIYDNVVLKYVDVRSYVDGSELYKKGFACKQFRLKQEPISYREYELKYFIDVKEKIKERELKSVLLNDTQIIVRKSIIKNTERIELLKNNSSVQLLSKQLKNKGLRPSEYIKDYNVNEFRNLLCDRFGFRLHSKISITKSKLHRHLRVGNKEIIGIDIKNSQPYFLSILTEDLIKKLIEVNPLLNGLEKIIPIINKYQEHEDIRRFNLLSQEGRLYEYLIKQYKKLFDLKVRRVEVKKIIYIAMFSDYSKHKKNRYYQKKDIKNTVSVFKSSFPNLYEMLNELQQVEIDNRVEKRKNIPLILQRIESTMMLDIICKTLYDYNQENENQLFFSTIHDSVMMINDTNQINIITNIINLSFKKLGVSSPKLSLK